MKNYKRLSLDEREEISRMLAQNCSLNEIANVVNHHVSAISREVNAGGYNKYTHRAGRAQRRAERNFQKREKNKRRLNLDRRLKQYVYQRLRLKWSPVQIAKELEKDYPLNMKMPAAPETIYTYLYALPRGALKKELLACLRQNRKRRHKQQRGVKTERKIENMLSIEERSKEVEDRIIPGHWEGDLIIGKNNCSALGTLVERTTRAVILVPVKSREAGCVHIAKTFAKEVKKLPAQMKLSMTYDQGREMAKYKLFTDITGVKVYFAHPRSSWERGTNENTNGLIRHFFPKELILTKCPCIKLKRRSIY